MKYNRIFLVIMDSVGAGELPDAKDYNDTGANTLKHIAQTAKGLNMPHMQALGLGNLTEIEVSKQVAGIFQSLGCSGNST